jgi:hypothetical protein
VFVSGHRRNPDPWILAIVWALYLPLIAVAFPEFVTTVLPLVQQSYLGIGGFTFEELLILPRLVEANATLLLLLFVGFPPPGKLDQDTGHLTYRRVDSGGLSKPQNLEVFPVFAKTHTK